MARTATLTLAAGVFLITAYAPVDTRGTPLADESRTIVVRMVEAGATEFAFEPAEFTVRPGDVIRFAQAGQLPHNVEFTDVPEGASLGDARVGPFLTAEGQTYDIVIDERFVAGEYEYMCTPHVALGMSGVLTVAPTTNP